MPSARSLAGRLSRVDAYPHQPMPPQHQHYQADDERQLARIAPRIGDLLRLPLPIELRVNLTINIKLVGEARRLRSLDLEVA